MSLDKIEPFEADNDEGPQLPRNGHSVTDATHPRFIERIVRCKDHGTFPYRTLTKHFTLKEHKAVGPPCPYCGSDKTYEYCEMSSPERIRYYHECVRLGRDQPVDQGKAVNPQLTDQDKAASSSHSTPTKLESGTQQYSETHGDAESGIGTACSSMVSLLFSAFDNNRRKSAFSKTSCNSSDNVSKEEGSPNNSSKNE